MRVLLLHNRYRELGGEERTVDDIAALLERRGDTVERLERFSGQAGALGATRGLIAGGTDPDEVARAVQTLGAEVVHAHNLHPLFGWRALAAAREAGARTVLHLHNFRLFCAIGIAYRAGEPCHRCSGRNTLPGLRFRCRGSAGEAAVYAYALSRQQPRLFEHADRFVAVSDRHRRTLEQLGLPGNRTVTLPNFVPDAQVAPEARPERGRYALVEGRLVPEKGFDTAVIAARAAGVPLVVAGDGPDLTRLRGLAGGGEVRFTGLLARDALEGLRRDAAVVLAPSRCEEAGPYSVLDACAAGIPVLASERTGRPELLPDAAILPADDPHAWTEALGRLWRDPEDRARVGAELLSTAREQLGEERYYRELIDLYRGR